MSAPFAIIKQAIIESRRNPRDVLRQLTNNGELMKRNLIRLANGEVMIPELPNGFIAAPIIPSPDVQLRANMYLDESLHGRAVPQTEIMKAEEEAKLMESIRVLSDDDLAREAERILREHKPAAIDVGPETDADLISEWDQILMRCWTAEVIQQQE